LITIFNVIWSYGFFGIRNPFLAYVIIGEFIEEDKNIIVVNNGRKRRIRIGRNISMNLGNNTISQISAIIDFD
jgi:hypothetical protein